MATMAADLSVVNAAVLIQAHVRSFLARKKLLEVRKEFDEVFRELERDSKLVCWKGRGFGLPLITADPLMLADANEETNLSTRQNGDGQKTRKEGFNFDVDVGELLSNAEKNGDNSDTEQCSLASGNLNIGTLCREQGDKESNEDDEVHWPKRPFNSERHGEDLLQNECFLPHDQALQRQENKGERNLLRQKSSEMLRPSDLTAEVTDTDSGNDKYPHKISEFSSSASALSSTLKHMTTDECEMKENAGHDNASGILLPQHMFGKLHLRDQALLSESWMTDRSFDPVTSDESITDLPSDAAKLRELREHIGMELLWTEQAIQSRKKYLGLRKGLAQCDQDSSSAINWE